MTSQTDKVADSSREGLVEYVIVLVLLAFAAVGVLAVFGQDIRDLFGAPARAQSVEASSTAQARPASPGGH